jgi:PAS domain S-box-containing protein/diguanylate cyclase (GGDEF)-like protein
MMHTIETDTIFLFALIGVAIALSLYYLFKQHFIQKALKKHLAATKDTLQKTLQTVIDLKRKKNPFELLSANQNDGDSLLISFDKGGIIFDVNESALNFFGYEKDELIGQNIFQVLKATDTLTEEMSFLEKISLNPRLMIEYETKNKKKNNETAYISWTNRFVYDEKGRVAQIYAIGFDITQKKKLEQEMTDLLTKDAVTGALNKNFFIKEAARELARARFFKTDFSLILMKLDYFQQLDSHKEYSFSDAALKDVADICRQILRPFDIFGRLEDVKFGIVLPSTDETAAQEVQEAIRTRILEKNLKTEHGESFLSPSFSFISGQKIQESIDFLLIKANDRLEKEK